ncbi:MAG: hypothetical protein ACT4P3_13340 [Betaproteobacteria bacterium]
MKTTVARLLEAMTPGARRRFGSDRQWAAACGLPAETLSRLRKRESCDFRTLEAVASAAGYALVPSPAPGDAGRFGREEEERLLDLCASGSTDPTAWRAHGDAFFMAGLAMMLASARGFDRRRYLELAEALHPGISVPEVFELWLERTPIRPGRFLPLARHRRQVAA